MPCYMPPAYKLIKLESASLSPIKKNAQKRGNFKLPQALALKNALLQELRLFPWQKLLGSWGLWGYIYGPVQPKLRKPFFFRIPPSAASWHSAFVPFAPVPFVMPLKTKKEGHPTPAFPKATEYCTPASIVRRAINTSQLTNVPPRPQKCIYRAAYRDHVIQYCAEFVPYHTAI